MKHSRLLLYVSFGTYFSAGLPFTFYATRLSQNQEQSMVKGSFRMSHGEPPRRPRSFETRFGVGFEIDFKCTSIYSQNVFIICLALGWGDPDSRLLFFSVAQTMAVAAYITMLL